MKILNTLKIIFYAIFLSGHVKDNNNLIEKWHNNHKLI